MEKKLGRARCVGFMYMGRTNGINLYKHGISRSYLNLDDDGNSYVAVRYGCYERANFAKELSKLEDCLRELRARLETPYDDAFIARKGEVLRQHGISLLRIQVEPDDVVVH